jgi:uncharacterized protein YjiK
MKKYLGLIFILLLNCNNEQLKPAHLEMMSIYKLEIPDLSGICLMPDKNTLITISDSEKKAYKINTSGKILDSFKLTCNDPEGICFIKEKNEFAVIDESNYTIYFYDTEFNEKYTRKISIENTTFNKGLEGICYNKKTKKLYLLNEKTPGLLIEYDLEKESFNKTSIDFSIDNTGIDYEPKEDLFYLTSHESKQIIACDYEGNVIKKFSLDIEKLEGIALDAANKKMYLVSDSDKKLFIYKY